MVTMGLTFEIDWPTRNMNRKGQIVRHALLLVMMIAEMLMSVMAFAVMILIPSKVNLIKNKTEKLSVKDHEADFFLYTKYRLIFYSLTK